MKRHLSSLTLSAIIASVILVCSAPPSLSDIPKIISYQGKVTDTGGTPIPDGTYDMQFSIWSSESGGFYPLWQSETHNVQVTDGIFSVLLGTVGTTPLDLDFAQDLWLEVTIEGDTQSPRQRFGSVGYAYMASGLVAGTEVSGTVSTGTNAAIAANNTATVGYGLYAEGHDCGVHGYTSTTSGHPYGVEGRVSSTVGRGVFGHADAGSGSTYGVYGESSSTDGTGVYGHAHRTSGSTYGVYGETWSPAGYGVYYSGGLAGTGSKSCVVETSHGPTLLYCQESPELWFEDFGEGQLIDGRATIELDPLFLKTVTIDEQNPMKVFVQLYDEGSHGVAVRKGQTGFDVIELENGHSSGTFDYRIVAKRKGFEERRLDYCKVAETDSYLHPELRGKGLRELQEERAGIEEERRRHEEARATMKPRHDRTARVIAPNTE